MIGAGLLVRLALAAAAVAALVAGYAWWAGQIREEGRQEIRDQWDRANVADREMRAKEWLRRIERQQENQRAQDAEIARLQAAAARNAADADRVRQQATDAARDWADRLADSPTAADLAAAAEAIRVCTELRGRADRRASLLAAYADAARAAGEGCEADYDTLRPTP